MTWRDAWSDNNDYSDDELDNKHEPVIVRSAGFLKRRDKTGITLVGCIDSDGGKHRPLFIAAGMIQSVVIIRR